MRIVELVKDVQVVTAIATCTDSYNYNESKDLGNPNPSWIVSREFVDLLSVIFLCKICSFVNDILFKITACQDKKEDTFCLKHTALVDTLSTHVC
jgi:hypothetical protein